MLVMQTVHLNLTVPLALWFGRMGNAHEFFLGFFYMRPRDSPLPEHFAAAGAGGPPLTDSLSKLN